MNGIFIFTVIAALFLYGCYVMKKLDAYSSENKSEQQKNLLRVAVEYTGMEIAIQRELEQIKLKYPDYQLLIYGEAKQHILELLKRDTVDIALLSGITPCSEFHYTVKEYAAEPHPTESAEDLYASVEDGQEVTVVWNDLGHNEILKALIALLTDENH